MVSDERMLLLRVLLGPQLRAELSEAHIKNKVAINTLLEISALALSLLYHDPPNVRLNFGKERGRMSLCIKGNVTIKPSPVYYKSYF